MHIRKLDLDQFGEGLPVDFVMAMKLRLAGSGTYRTEGCLSGGAYGTACCANN